MATWLCWNHTKPPAPPHMSPAWGLDTQASSQATVCSRPSRARRQTAPGREQGRTGWEGTAQDWEPGPAAAEGHSATGPGPPRLQLDPGPSGRAGKGPGLTQPSPFLNEDTAPVDPGGGRRNRGYRHCGWVGQGSPPNISQTHTCVQTHRLTWTRTPPQAQAPLGNSLCGGWPVRSQGSSAGRHGQGQGQSYRESDLEPHPSLSRGSSRISVSARVCTCVRLCLSLCAMHTCGYKCVHLWAHMSMCVHVCKNVCASMSKCMRSCVSLCTRALHTCMYGSVATVCTRVRWHVHAHFCSCLPPLPSHTFSSVSNVSSQLPYLSGSAD